jgi:hypothetical protein
MKSLEGWAFLALMFCLVGITMALTILEGTPAIAVVVASVVLGILSGGLYAASAREKPE